MVCERHTIGGLDERIFLTRDRSAERSHSRSRVSDRPGFGSIGRMCHRLCRGFGHSAWAAGFSFCPRCRLSSTLGSWLSWYRLHQIFSSPWHVALVKYSSCYRKCTPMRGITIAPPPPPLPIDECRVTDDKSDSNAAQASNALSTGQQMCPCVIVSRATNIATTTAAILPRINFGLHVSSMRSAATGATPGRGTAQWLEVKSPQS